MDTVAGYRIAGVLGSGGMGLVYRADPPKGGGSVALKVLRREVCSELARRRFAREAAAVQALQHPNVVRIVAFGDTEDGGLYLAMELLEGEDLETRVERTGPLEFRESVRIAVAASEGLGAAHRAGIVHRDVKPANIFLCADGSVRLLDFGLAITVTETLETRLTASNMVMGTPAYMAIEQAKGSHDEDARTDVWGLGATLYHALCGRPPFEAPTIMAQLVRVVTDEPDPFPPEVPPWLRAVVVRALHKERRLRWPSMEALAEALGKGLQRTTPLEMTRTSVLPPEPGALTLWDEVRIVSVLLGEDVSDPAGFGETVREENGVAYSLVGRRAVGLFGGEAWQGDEAARATRAGLAVRRRDPGTRLGIATGRGLKEHAGDFTGAVVAAAEGVVRPQGVGVDAETLRRIRGGFDVAAGIVTARRPGAGVIGVRGLGGADTPIFGRERELSDLEMTLRQVITEGQASGVLLIGPAGMGKSRVLHALRDRLEDLGSPFVFLHSRGESHRKLQGWHAIGNALRSHTALPEGTAAAVVRDRLLAICPTRSSAEFVGEILGADFPESPHLHIARADPQIMHDRVVMAMGDLFEALTAAGTVVLAVEDLHWADSPSIELTEVLLRRLEERPFLVVGTSRPELDLPMPDFRRISLQGLTRQATRALVQAVLGDRPETTSVAEAIHERSGGHPFFVEELALAWREGRADTLSASVEAAVQARLDALPRSDKDVLRRASVLGRRFWPEALVAMGEPAPLPSLERLRRRELVSSDAGPRPSSAEEWSFRHALVQEVAYGSLTPEQRAALHLAAGQWLSTRPDAIGVEVARHLELGGDAAAASPYWLEAARDAFRDGDAPLALEASGRALERLNEPDTAVRLRLVRADVLHYLGRTDEEEVELEALAALAVRDKHRTRVDERRARFLRFRGRYEEADRVLREALRRAPESVELWIQDALTRAESGHVHQSLRAAEAAVAGARSGRSPHQLGIALGTLCYCRGMSGDVGGALSLVEPVLGALEEVGDPRVMAQARALLAFTAVAYGRPERALRELEKARALCRAAGNRRDEGWLMQNLAIAHAGVGALDAALQAQEQAMQIATETRQPRLAFACLKRRAEILLEAGRLAEALESIEAALETPEEVRGFVAPALLALHARALFALGRREQACQQAVRALELRDRAGGMPENEADVFLAAHEAGVSGALERGLAALLGRARRIGDPFIRRSFLEAVPAHARTVALARAAGVKDHVE